MKTFYRPTLEVADVFKKYGHLLGPIPQEQHKVISDIKNCRTEILGGHKLKCDSCEYQKNAYNSCRNRHCPKCQFMAKVKWVEKRMEDLLPCQYFHVVFTLPSKLRALILRNKKVTYGLLFKAASQALKEVAENPKNLGAEIGFIGVLHTWSQDLIDHPHIHFIVPGGGLNKQKTKWIPCKKDYFLPIQILSKVFRGKMLSFIEKAFEQGDLIFPGEIEYLQNYSSFKALMIDCTSEDWVVYSKKPFAGPEQVINYLGNYTHRIAISNYRLIKIEDGKVFFKCRNRDDPKTKKVVSLRVEEFMRRFLLHVLPKKFVRIRHFGLLGNRLRKEKIAIVRKLNGIVEKVQEVLQESWQQILERVTGICVKVCPKCRSGTLVEVAELSGILNSS